MFIIAEEGTVQHTGTITAKNKDGSSGTVHILGEKVHVLKEALIDVSADKGSGEILLGGDYQGKNPEILNAKQLFVAKDVTIKANALKHGNGGKIICWSDQDTRFYGKAYAQGGREAGEGWIGQGGSMKSTLFVAVFMHSITVILHFA